MEKNLTKNEQVVLKAIVENAREIGDSSVEFIMSDVANMTGKSQKSIQGVCSSLQKKGFLSCANGDCYFDGQISLEAEQWYKETFESKEEEDEPIIDERVVRLNEIINTKSSSVSKTKREQLKVAKTAAKYILDNWDNAELDDGGLKIYLNDIEMKEKNEELHQIAESRYNQLVELAAKEIEEKMKNDAPKKETTPKSTASKKSGKTTSTTKKTSGTARKVGDHHPTKPWIWTEYKPGKFDWRTDKTIIDEKKVVAKKNKTDKKQAKKAEEPKQITTEEFVSITKSNKRNLSATQAEYLKLLKKGYWIWNNDGHYFFKNEEGKMKKCNMDSLKSLFKKFNIEEIPSCLIR